MITELCYRGFQLDSLRFDNSPLGWTSDDLNLAIDRVGGCDIVYDALEIPERPNR